MTETPALREPSARAAIVVGDGEDAPRYHLFEVRELEPERAVLAGEAVLEPAEEFQVEIDGPDAAPVRAIARVVGLERSSAAPGMRVALSGIGDAERDTLARWAAAGKP